MPASPNNTPAPTSESVGEFYDHMGLFFDSLYGENIHFGLWDDDPNPSMPEAQNRLTDRLIDTLHLRDDDYLLDVGCGTGHPALRLAERTQARVLGVSISPTQVARATEKAHTAGLAAQLQFIQADAMHLPHEPETFDAAWAIEMLFHVPDRLQVLREIHRTLKPGGRLVLADFIQTDHLTEDDWNLLTQGFAFSTLLRADTYADVITQAGLEVVQIHDVTAETRQNIRWIEFRYADHREDLAAHYGADFTTQMDRLLPTGVSIYTEKLGYVIAEARRPVV
ncbi:cyclopropane fatty-acyl-phospholipid synthase-like methyltransferase [Kitasatospora sp. MAA19]|uniref:class I SAM-dependent methyltransferase n=1 Tax=unclassified Kitasatospora TaxID=2633591 RepID=UPI00247622C9|nr:class I SAM-dependent methyltransferase [Kitasatospora sp. MAA19]MDH6709525.1 cyclopropane fatty-acyl-phospholipid synthase-like methyltransferase [Kitasatospora sp. MAA19]